MGKSTRDGWSAGSLRTRSEDGCLWRNRCRNLLWSVLVSFVFLPLTPCQASDPLSAIDILLEPDDPMLTQAKADNARLRENYTGGFALDAAHTAHISVLQCYVRTRDLDKVFAAVRQASDIHKPVGMELKTIGYFYIPWQGQELAGINIAPTPELLKYQESIVAAVAPFNAGHGTASAFVPNGDGTPVVEMTAAYVNTFIPQHIGKDYNPHVTIGLGREDFLKEMTAAPYTPVTFRIRSVGVYHLGEFGTAKKKLWTSAAQPPLPPESLTE